MYFAPGYTVDSQTPQTYPSRNALFNRTSSSPPYLHFKIWFPPSASPWSETSLLFSLRNEGATAPQRSRAPSKQRSTGRAILAASKKIARIRDAQTDVGNGKKMGYG